MYRRQNATLRLLSIVFMMFFVAMFTYGVGCGGGTAKPDGGTTPDSSSGSKKEGEDCAATTDCESGLFCSSGKKCATPQCGVDGKTCDAGKECKNGECVTAGGADCEDNSGCPAGEVCKEKKCVKDDGPQPVATVEILTKASAIREGATLNLQAAAYNASGARLPGPHDFKWASSATGTVSVDETSGVATGGGTEGEADITVSVGDKTSAPLKLRNFAKPAAGKVRVIVRDGEGKPIADATVKVGDKEGKTGADGAATLDGTAPFDVHIFHNDYSYFSALGISKNDLFVQLVKNPDNTKAGGVKGRFDFTKVQSLLGISEDDWAASVVGFGLAGFSIPGNLIDLDFDTLLGESFKTKVFSFEANLPSGLVVELADGGKPDYQAMSENGRRILWALGGKFKFEEVQPLIADAMGGGEIDVGKILTKALPLFKKFVFGSMDNITVQTYAKVTDVNDINGDGKNDDLIPDFTKFPEKKVVLDKLLDQTLKVNVSNLPTAKDSGGKDIPLYVISLAGVRVAGAGVVPLGLAVGEAGSTSLEVKYAKPAGVLASGKFLVLTIALSLPLGTDPPPLLVAGNLQFLSNPGTVTVNSFVSFGTSAKLDPATRKLSTAKVDGSDLQMLQITSKDGKRWMVVYGDSAEVTVPAVPSGMTDRLDADASASLFGVKLNNQTLDSLLEFNTLNMDRLVEVVQGFSNVTVYEKPKAP